jgi:hypothetical protein
VYQKGVQYLKQETNKKKTTAVAAVPAPAVFLALPVLADEAKMKTIIVYDASTRRAEDERPPSIVTVNAADVAFTRVRGQKNDVHADHRRKCRLARIRARYGLKSIGYPKNTPTRNKYFNISTLRLMTPLDHAQIKTLY